MREFGFDDCFRLSNSVWSVRISQCIWCIYEVLLTYLAILMTLRAKRCPLEGAILSCLIQIEMTIRRKDGGYSVMMGFK